MVKMIILIVGWVLEDCMMGWLTFIRRMVIFRGVYYREFKSMIILIICTNFKNN